MKNFLIIITLVFLCMWATNPTKNDHRKMFTEKVSAMEDINTNPLIDILSYAVSTHYLAYSDYIIFSTTTVNVHGLQKTATIGVFGKVIVLGTLG